MPTYEYTCQECDHTFEVRQSIHDDPLKTCPDCGGHLRKVFGNVGVVFKGSGFYKTDSRAESRRGSKGKGDKASKDGSGPETGASGDKATSEKASPDSGGDSKSSGEKSKKADGSAKTASGG